jgi:mannose-6-phosphate isomerase-like protein (cupin superfamily)
MRSGGSARRSRRAPLARDVLGPPDGSFVLAEWTDDGKTSRDVPIAPLHRHLDEDEAWYVLEGRLGFQVGADEVVADAGAAVVVPRGAPHTYWNAGDGTARYLLVMGPKTHRLIEAIHAATSRDLPAMQALFRAHDSELLTS